MINPNQDPQSALDRILEQEMADILIDDYGRTLCEVAAREAIEDAVLDVVLGGLPERYVQMMAKQKMGIHAEADAERWN